MPNHLSVWIAGIACIVAGVLGLVSCFLTWSTLVGSPNYYPDPHDVPIDLFQLHSWSKSTGDVLAPWVLIVGAACIVIAGLTLLASRHPRDIQMSVPLLILSGVALVAVGSLIVIAPGVSAVIRHCPDLDRCPRARHFVGQLHKLGFTLALVSAGVGLLPFIASLNGRRRAPTCFTALLRGNTVNLPLGD